MATAAIITAIATLLTALVGGVVAMVKLFRGNGDDSPHGMITVSAADYTRIVGDLRACEVERDELRKR